MKSTPRILLATPKLIERFWAKVDRTNDCWAWTGGCHQNGYGSFQVKLADGRFVSELAHRVSWMIANGTDQIPGNKFVCHHCDNPPCVRPSHLFLGDDPETKPQGEAHYEAHFTDDQVRAIRKAVESGAVMADLAKIHGVTRQAVWRMVHRVSWKHVS